VKNIQYYGTGFVEKLYDEVRLRIKESSSGHSFHIGKVSGKISKGLIRSMHSKITAAVRGKFDSS